MGSDLSEVRHLPKAESLLMSSLAGGPKHGYAMMQDIRQEYGTRLGPGTIYNAIARLETHGLIAPVPCDDRRQPYRLTEAGVILLREHLIELQRFAVSGLKQLASS